MASRILFSCGSGGGNAQYVHIHIEGAMTTMEYKHMTAKMISIVGMTCVGFILVGFLYFRSSAAIPFALGVLLASALNCVKLKLLERAVDRAVTLGKEAVGKYIQTQYILRFLLTGLVLAAAATLPFIDLWGAVAGLFTMQIAVLFVRKSEKSAGGGGA